MTWSNDNGAPPRHEARVDLGRGSAIGRVVRVDSHHADVEISEIGLASQVTVSDLVALRRSSDVFLIGLVEAVVGGDASAAGERKSHSLLRLALIGTLEQGAGLEPDKFTRGSGSFPHVGAECHAIEGKELRDLVSLLGAGVAPDEQLALGHFIADRDAAAIADGNRMFQRHVALIGNTGAGKSWAVALMLERASRLGHANLIVFDMHGEYTPLCEPKDGRAPVARRLRIAGPGDMRDEDDVLFLPYWLLDRHEMLSLTLDVTDPNASDQAMRFSHHMHTLKESMLRDEEREDVIATFTVDSPIPYQLDRILLFLEKDNTERIVRQPSGRVEPGPYTGRMTGFITRLEARIADRRYGFMFSPPEETLSYTWLAGTAAKLLEAGAGGSGIKVIDFSEVPADILPVVAGVLARLIYDIQFWMAPEKRTPVCFVCDEAHLYLPTREESTPVHRAALHAFEEIAKEGRKYGVALLVVSQRPADVSRTILSQCNNFIVMRLTNDHDQRVVQRLMPESLAGVTGVLPILDVGEAIVLGDAILIPTRLKLDPPTIPPASSTRAFWTDWATRPSSEEAIAGGVEALRAQVRRSGWEHQLGAYSALAGAERIFRETPPDSGY